MPFFSPSISKKGEEKEEGGGGVEEREREKRSILGGLRPLAERGPEKEEGEEEGGG